MEAVIKDSVPVARTGIRWRQVAEGFLLAGILACLYIYARGQGTGCAEVSGKPAAGYEMTDAGKMDLVNLLQKQAMGLSDISDLDRLIAERENKEESPERMENDSQTAPFAVQAEEIPVMASEEEGKDGEQKPSISSMTVSIYGNGGVPEHTTFSIEWENFDVESLEIPRRLGKEFDGWYLDAACTKPFEGLSQMQESLELYACWKEFDGFLCNDKGHVTGYTDLSVATDGILAFPRSPDCTGVEYGSLEGLEDIVMEVYIYTNITYIAPEVFDHLYFLMYIEVAPDNPSYYSVDGILYSMSGELVAYPNGRNLFGAEP